MCNEFAKKNISVTFCRSERKQLSLSNNTTNNIVHCVETFYCFTVRCQSTSIFYWNAIKKKLKKLIRKVVRLSTLFTTIVLIHTTRRRLFFILNFPQKRPIFFWLIEHSILVVFLFIVAEGNEA